MAYPIPPLAPRCVAARRKDVHLVLCALLGGPPVAALRFLRAPAWQHRCSRPCGTLAPSPGRGSRHVHWSFEGHSAQLLLHPHPLNRQTLLNPPIILGCPS